jgi:hypothetical protein
VLRACGAFKVSVCVRGSEGCECNRFIQNKLRNRMTEGIYASAIAELWGAALYRLADYRRFTATFASSLSGTKSTTMF